MNQLGRNLQSGDLTSAQQAYASLQQYAISNGALQGVAAPSINPTA